jgi:hypothetical protein
MARGTRTERVNEETGEVTEEETSLALSEPGGMMAATFDDLVNAPGVSIVKTIKVGDPANGGIGAYAGAVVAPGEPVKTTLQVPGAGGQMVTIEGLLPTWSCHPVKLVKTDDGVEWRVVPNVTHVIITPHQLNAALARILKRAEEVQSVGLFAVRWNGKVSIKGGRQQINDFSVVEKYEPKAGGEAAA